MKKLFSLLLALLFCLSFASCDREAPKLTDSTTASPTPTNPNAPKSAVTQAIVRVDYRDDKTGALWPEGNILNRDTFIFSDKKHLAVYRCDSTAELAAFKETYGGFLDCMWTPKENGTEFDEVTAGCDEGFFEENTLLLTHWTATSGSYSFKLTGVTPDDGTMTVHIMQERPKSDMMTADMASWLAAVPVKRADITEDTKFDAILEKEKAPPTSDFVQDKSVVNVGYALGEVYLVLAENDDTFILSDKKHLPVYKCASVDELESFRLNLGSSFELTRRYDGFPSFAEVTEGLGEDFFEENVLLLVYVEATSGSYRFGVQRIEVSDDTVTVLVEQTNNPEIMTCDMAGWLVMAVVEKDGLADGVRYDAILD